MYMNLFKKTHSLALFFLIALTFGEQAFAACGANTRTWQADAGSDRWDTNNNWNPRNWPSSNTENAVIESDWYFPDYPNRNITLGCFEIQSGLLTVDRNRTLTIEGDYFRSYSANAFQMSDPVGSDFTVYMDGTAEQFFDLNDDLSILRIGNPTTVNIGSHPFIHNEFEIDNGAGVINLNSDFDIMPTAVDVTIPSGTSVVVKNGSTFRVQRNLTVDGVLRVEAGGRVEIGDGRTLTVGAAGTLLLNGSSGNIASLDSYNGGRFTLNVAGALNLNYFSISRTQTAGVNLTGSLQFIQNGDFNYIQTNGYAITLGATASAPVSWNTVGFYDQGGAGTQRNINATAYTGSVITINDWSGKGGTPNETDPSNKLTWGDEAEVKLHVTNATVAGNPPATIGVSSAETLFATFSFSMTGTAPSATDISQIIFTLAGSNNASDINQLKVYKDTNANCVYNNGVDTLIGSALSPSGSPATATLNLPASTISVIDSTIQCVHVTLSTSASAQSGSTLGVSIAATADITNSQGYAFSTSGAPPINGDLTTVNGAPISIWHGGYGSPANGGTYTQTTNWSPNTIPTATRDCEIGIGYSYPEFPNNTTRPCLNASLPSGGRMSWDNYSTNFAIYGSLSIGSSYTFTSAANGTIEFAGSGNQSVNANTTFPGNLLINNSGGAVGINTDWTVSGNLTLTSGVLNIASGKTLTIGGNINVNGGELRIEPGATLALSNGRSLTVGASGTLTLVGTAGQSASITSVNTGSSYSITVNGTIKANYYSLSRMNTTGLVINSGATIDASSYLQNGSYSYPIGNGGSFLRLNRQVPGNALSGMTFDAGGSGATGKVNIQTNTGAGTLTVSSYNGSWSGEAYDTDPTYVVDWTSPTNTLDLTLLTSNPASYNQGLNYLMANYRFKQTQAGAFNNTNITSVKLTMTGTATASDIVDVEAYYDASCSGTGGTLLGSASFSGVPATATISGMSGAIVQSHATTPPNRCIYFRANINSLATDSATLGLSIESGTHVTNSESYSFNAASAPPLTSGTPGTIVGSTTIWNGSRNTAWTDDRNWSGGLPTASLNCIINSATRDPIISTGTARCKSLTIGNGTLTMTGGTLEISGSFDNTGTFTQGTRPLVIRDDGTNASTQNIRSVNTFNNITFTKTAGGSVTFGAGTTTISTALTMGGANNFELKVGSARKLRLNNGLVANGATFNIQSGGIVEMGSGSSSSVSGSGTFKMSGNAEAMPNTDEDNYPAYFTTAKATLRSESGTFNFATTGGTVSLNGFVIENMGTNGFVIGGNTVLSTLSGGQFAKLNPSYASMKALQINTTGSIPVTANNIGFNWETTDGGATPASNAGYLLLSSTGCSSQTMDFTNWYGDWFGEVATFDVDDVKSTSACNLNWGAVGSAVTLTSLTAKPYNTEVLIEWETLFEQDHDGFNIFRADQFGQNFTQINSELIRNNLSSTTYKGKYQFIDKNLTNDETYYYYIQDVDVNGLSEIHGPVSATPKASLGAAPVAGGGVNDGGDNPDAPGSGTSPGPIYNPSYKNLGGGVEILSQTSKGLRLKIIPGAITFTPSPWNGSYEQVAISSYSKTQKPYFPELLTRTLLIDVNPFVTSHEITNISASETIIPGKAIAPAPRYTPDGGGVLVADYQTDATAYSSSTLSPSSYLEIDSEFVTVGGRKMLRVVINPLMFAPATGQLYRLDQAIVDIGLNGAVWDTPAPSSNAQLTPGALANTLKIGVSSSGMYQLTYDQLNVANVDGPFAGVDIDSLRLYKGSNEAALKVIDANTDTFFNSGDSIVFFGKHDESLFDQQSHYVLTDFDVYDSALTPRRFSSIDGSIGASRTDEVQSFYTATKYEQNNDIVLGEPVNLDDSELVDVFIWKTLRSGTANDNLVVTANMANLDTGDATVRVNIRLKGYELDVGDTDYEHHLELHINAVKATEAFFSSRDFQTLSFDVPMSYFSAGNNDIKLFVPGTNAAPLGQRDIMHFDSIEVQYYAFPVASSDLAYINKAEANALVSGYTFSTNALSIFDTTDEFAVGEVTNASINPVAANYDVYFLATDDDASELLRDYIVTSSAQFKTVSSLSLSSGYQSSLKDNSRQAQMLVIGHKNLLYAAQALKERRDQQGIQTTLVSLEQIYSEFSNDQRSPKAIKDFLTYASSNWASPKLKYVFFLGDANYDQLDHFGYGTQAADFPMPILGGRFIGYATDNYFVSSTSSYLPNISVGRLPTNNPTEVASYIEKIIAYEDGTSTPKAKALGASFIAGEELYVNGDGFSARIDELSKIPSRLSSDIIDHKVLGSNAATKTAILDRFNTDAPLLMTYMGHGAPNLWGSLSLLQNTDFDALQNQELPIVMSLNCENTMFYDPDRSQSFKTVGESLVLNPDGGAISFIGSSTQTTPVAQMYYANAFLQALNKKINNPYTRTTVGELFNEAKIAIGSDVYSADVVKSMMLFGDPSVSLPKEIFAAAPVAAPAEGKKKGFGCSAGASDGTTHIPWYEGVLEMLLLLALTFGLRRFIKV
tara:strand:+ start:60784 stop:68310 length:7527 start_codon:yes stop_codon:yes gene_type:complete